MKIIATEDKYGFVYIWMDRKHKRFYVGCHWGAENDGYVCSSIHMRNAYKKRPNDFRRRILSRVLSSRGDLFTKEAEWLALIKNEELGKRYYNISKKHSGHWSTAAPSRFMSIKEKMSIAARRRVVTEETRKKMAESARKTYADPAVRAAHSLLMRGKGTGKRKPHTEDAKKRMSAGHQARKALFPPKRKRWEVAGVSRSTWWRRRKALRELAVMQFSGGKLPPALPQTSQVY